MVKMISVMLIVASLLCFFLTWRGGYESTPQGALAQCEAGAAPGAENCVTPPPGKIVFVWHPQVVGTFVLGLILFISGFYGWSYHLKLRRRSLATRAT